jgi:serine/threonine-protein kinase
VRSDIYSLGATLYHLLTNEAPRDAKTRYIQTRRQGALGIRQINPGVSSQTEQAVLHALGLHPEERPDSIDQFRQELLDNAPIIINGNKTNGWQFAIWRNRILIALITALLTLAIILTFTPGFDTNAQLPVQLPIGEVGTN